MQKFDERDIMLSDASIVVSIRIDFNDKLKPVLFHHF
jgi:hypothetical protein